LTDYNSHDQGSHEVKRFYGIRAHVDGNYRKETFLGKDYIVVPVVALVEGVIQGMMAAGPELALAEEFGRFPQGWNGRPLTMEHPIDDEGNPVSANSPSTLKSYQIGQLFNTRVKSGKLHTEAWVEVVRAKGLNTNSKATLKALQAGEMIEVSTGYFSQIEETAGEFNGEDYIAIQRNIVPDHLAFLPDGTLGACSNEDGCGAPRTNSTSLFRVNADCGCGCNGNGDCQVTLANEAVHEQETTTIGLKSTGSTVEDIATNVPGAYDNYTKETNGIADGVSKDTLLDLDLDLNEVSTEERAAARKRRKKMKKVTNPGAYEATGAGGVALNIIAQSFPDSMLDGDARKLISAALQKMQKYSYVIGMTPSMVVYEQYDQFSGTYKTFRRGFDIAKDGKVTLKDNIEEVVLITKILPVANSEGKEPEETTEQANMTTQVKAPETQEKKKDEVTTQTAAVMTVQTAAITTVEPRLTIHKSKDKDGNEVEITVNEKGEVTDTKVTLKAAQEPEKAPPRTVNEYIAQAPAEIQEVLNSSVKLHQSRKDELIANLKKTNRCKFGDDALKVMSLDMLENLAQLADVPTYDGQARPITAQAASNEGVPDAPRCWEPEIVEGGKKTA